MKNKDLENFVNHFRLSPRETEVVETLLVRKISIKDIAAHLNLSPSTVNNHLNNIFSKTKTSSKAELIVSLLQFMSARMQALEVYQKTPKVLVIDDEPEICDIVTQIMHSNGFQALSVSIPEQVPELISKNDFDFVVSDIRMPGLDGFELLKQVRKTHHYRPSVIFVTGQTVYSKEEAYDLGAIALLSKPIDFEQLLQLMMEDFIEEYDVKKSLVSRNRNEVIKLSYTIQVKTINLGMGGMFIDFADLDELENSKFEIGKTLEFKIQLEGSPRSIPVIGEVKWSRPQVTNNLRKGAGVKILEIDRDSKNYMENLVRANNILSYIPIGQQTTNKTLII